MLESSLAHQPAGSAALQPLPQLGNEIVGFVDHLSLTPDQNLSALHVRGWVLTRYGSIASLEVGIAGQVLQAVNRHSRPDVDKSYQSEYQQPAYGFSALLPLSGAALSSERQLVLRATLADKRSFTILTVPFVPRQLPGADLLPDPQETTGAWSPASEPSLLEGLVAGKSLADQLKRSGIPDEMLDATLLRRMAAQRLRYDTLTRHDLRERSPAPRPIPLFADSSAEEEKHFKPLSICLATVDFIGPAKNGGIGTFTTALAELLAAAGHFVTVVFCSQQVCEEASFDLWKIHYKSRGIDFTVIQPDSGELDGHLFVKLSYQVYAWLKERHFDVIHFHEMVGIGYYSVLAKKLGMSFADTRLCVGIHSPLTWHFGFNHNYLYGTDYLELDFMEHQCVRYADICFSPSQHLFDWVQKNGWELPDECFVLPHPIPRDLLDKKPANRELPIREFVFFGRLETRKGVEVFCEALDYLNQQMDCEFQVTFLGKEGLAARNGALRYIKRMARRWRFRVNIITDKSYREALTYVSGEGRLAVLPSLADSTSYTLYECLILGIPFIASDNSGMPEAIAAEYHEQVLVRPEPKALAERLLELFNSPPRVVPPKFFPQQSEHLWLGFHRHIARMNSGKSAARPRKSAPLVSVCVTATGSGEELDACMSSISAQTYGRTEVLLVVPPDARTAVQPYVSSLSALSEVMPVKIINCPRDSEGAARNLAACNAGGDYLVFVNAQHILKPDAIFTLVEAARTGNADITTCFVDTFSLANYMQPTSRKLYLGGPESIGIWCNNYGSSFFLATRTAFLDTGGWSEDTDLESGAWEYLARSAVTGLQLFVVPEFLLWHRVRPQTVGKRIEQSRNEHKSLRPFQDRLGHLAQLAEISRALAQEVSRRCRHSVHRYSPQEHLQQAFVASDLLLFRASETLGFGGFSVDSATRVLSSAPLLRLEAGNADPQLYLVGCNIVGTAASIGRIRLHSPEHTTFQVFYIPRGSSGFSEEFSYKAPLHPGTNEIYFLLPADITVDELRIDPGCCPGRFEIKSIEIRAI